MSSRGYMCEDRGVPRPATGKTPLRNFRIAEDLWKAAQAKAAAEGRTLTEVVVSYLRRYAASPVRKKPDSE